MTYEEWIFTFASVYLDLIEGTDDFLYCNRILT